MGWAGVWEGAVVYLLASRSAGKLAELRALLAQAGIEVTDLDVLGVPELSWEDNVESYDTFEENALAKARHFHALTGFPTFADDSGLVVAGLGGRPGVRSKRWSGRPDLSGEALDAANSGMLLSELARAGVRIPAAAAYVCAAAFVGAGHEWVSLGRTCGRIVLPPRGEGGFGYDPYFESADLGLTFAEAGADAKLRVSHRGRAFRALLSSVALPWEGH